MTVLRMKTNLAFASAVLALFIITSSSGLAGGESGRAFRPKRFTFEFASPFDPEDPENKAPGAKMVIEVRADAKGHYPEDVHHSRTASITITVGKNRLEVPPPLLRDLGAVNLLSVDLRWQGSMIVMTFWGGPPEDGKVVLLRWSNGKLTQITIDGQPFNQSYGDYVGPHTPPP